MKKVIKLTESDLARIVKRVIMEQDHFKPDQLYRRESAIARIKRGPKFIHKYAKTLPKLKKEGSDEVWTKIPQVVWQNW
jgi:recombination DNA repair RAD52 pathway protein